MIGPCPAALPLPLLPLGCPVLKVDTAVRPWDLPLNRLPDPLWPMVAAVATNVTRARKRAAWPLRSRIRRGWGAGRGSVAQRVPRSAAPLCCRPVAHIYDVPFVPSHEGDVSVSKPRCEMEGANTISACKYEFKCCQSSSMDRLPRKLRRM